MGLTRLAYVNACLHAINAPQLNVQHVSLMTRITQEWGNASGQGPRNNALDLTQYEGGATPFNSFGPDHQYHVWHYPNLSTGVKAFHDIMGGLEYASVLHLLQRGGLPGPYERITADEVIAEWNKTPWGYCQPSLVGQTRSNFNRYAKLLVAE